MEAVKHLKSTTGMSINLSKSQIALAGVKQVDKARLSGLTNIPEGKLPFTYLGCPITSNRLSTADCDALLEKLTARITSWKTKNLSYAGRARLISSVLMGIINFWARIFLIPGKMMKCVQALCRNYLWGAEERYKKAPLISWEETCKPKDRGRGERGTVWCGI
ncbi:hypothetical protein DM860_010335 [Cuscuta australis]|uniref:Reverse transcriptase domain-containing protein n=1 Tax=Cuscuta australis TaxID=267555 RepID=A0A328DB57_9ASTE|nr:hypothetical protein DM860_010335 [Cuscuta australis]